MGRNMARRLQINHHTRHQDVMCGVGATSIEEQWLRNFPLDLSAESGRLLVF
jgi:hypothetical protein